MKNPIGRNEVVGILVSEVFRWMSESAGQEAKLSD